MQSPAAATPETSTPRIVDRGKGDISVEVKLFGAYADLAGRRETTLALASGSTLADLVGRLRGKWTWLPVSPATAVNQAYLEPGEALSTALADGDEVALIPPVAGG